MKKINNKGLSLVELIVAIAIFAIVGIAVCGFMSFCSKNFSTSNRNIKIQYEQQLVVNQIRDTVLETSQAIWYDTTKKALMVFGLDPEYDPTDLTTNRYIITELRFEASTETGKPGKLLRDTYNITGEQSKLYNKLGDIPISFTNESSICDSIKEFDVAIYDLEGNKITAMVEDNDVSKVVLDITFMVGDKEIANTATIAVRNQITAATNDTTLDKIYEPLTVDPFSYVRSVSITRDGKVFSQGRTDTIKMVGSITDTGIKTTAAYGAIVTMKNGNVNNNVTWELDPNFIDGTKNAAYGCITLSADGKVTLVNAKDGANVITPNDCLAGHDYFILIARSVDDPSKEGRLRIKVEEGGIYPVSITTKNPKDSYVMDLINGQLIYTFEHEITYTGKIADPVTGNQVNPLKGEGVYQKIKYVECLDENGDPTPKGAGFTAADVVDGKFIVTKSMEKHTYTIKVKVNENDQNGDPVEDTFTLTIPEGIVPAKQEITVPDFGIPQEVLRGEFTPFTANWTNGSPTYAGDVYNTHGQKVDDQKTYFYWYEWEIKKVDSSWANGEKDNFDKLVYLVDTQENPLNGSKVKNYTANDKGDRIIRVFTEPYLDWNKSFMYSVTLRAKISEVNNRNAAKYYMKPGTDPKNPASVTTNDINKACATTKIVTINPVSLTLTPVEAKYYRYNQISQGYFYSTFNTKSEIGIGRKGGTNNTEKDEKQYYYKSFEPVFKGLSFTNFNFGRNLLGNANTWDYNYQGAVQTKLSSGETTLQVYYQNGSRFTYANVDPNSFSCGIWFTSSIDNKLYIYLKMAPKNWIKTNQVPVGCRWQCIIKDPKGNSVTAQFAPNNAKAVDYTIVNKETN